MPMDRHMGSCFLHNYSFSRRVLRKFVGGGELIIGIESQNLQDVNDITCRGGMHADVMTTVDEQTRDCNT